MPRHVENPNNRFVHAHVDWDGAPPPAELEVFEENPRTIVATNESPDVGFRFSVNPYRGCYHGCAYCYARPYHQYIGFGAGTDFERKIVVKVNAPELLRDRFRRDSWEGDTVCFSGITDCYQPLEARYRLTRACLEVCSEFRNPVVIITKGALVERDIDVLGELAEHARARVFISIPFLHDEDGRRIEPYASSISKRFAALKRLSDHAIPTGVSVSPIIPGLNDAFIPAILERARWAGATRAFMTLLRLPGEVEGVFRKRLREEFPERASKVEHAIAQVRRGKMNESEFGSRMTGHGARWAVIESLFRTHAKRLGFKVEQAGTKPEETTFRRASKQLPLFS